MEQLLKDKQLNDQLQEKGFVTISFLHPKEVAYLQEVYNGLHPSGNDGFYTSMNLEVVEDRFKVDAAIKEIFGPKLQQLYVKHTPLFGNFTIKKPEGQSALKLHLDWSTVDEAEHLAIGVWVPLVDVNEKNGAFGVLEGSHQYGLTRRGSPINFIASHPDTKKSDSVLTDMKAQYEPKLICVPAGTAVIYDMRLAHFSPPNTTGKLRVACNLISLPEGVEPVHFYRNEDGLMETLQANQRFYLSHNMVESPIGELGHGKLQEPDEQWAIEEQYDTPVLIDFDQAEPVSYVKATSLEETNNAKSTGFLDSLKRLLKV